MPVTSSHVSVPATRKRERLRWDAGHALGVPPLTPRQLNRATLARQLLLRREPLGRRRRGAPGGRHPGAGGGVALHRPVEPASPASIRPTSTPRSPSGAVVKATLMRITLHAVDAEDYPDLHAGDAPDAAGGAAQRPPLHRGPACPPPTSTPWCPDLLAFASPTAQRTRRWRPGRGPPRRRPRSRGRGGRCGRSPRWSTPRPAGRGRSGPRPRTCASPSRRPGPRDRGRRCSCSCGATWRGSGRRRAKDIAQFALLEHADRPGGARRPWATAAPRSRARAGPRCTTSPDGARSRRRTRRAPPRLMAMWDSILLAYADRSRIMPRRVPPAGHPPQRRRAPDPAGRRLRCRGVAAVDGGIEADGASTRSPTTPGTVSAPRPGTCSRSWPAATPPSTAATHAGGRRSRAPRSASCVDVRPAAPRATDGAISSSSCSVQGAPAELGPEEREAPDQSFRSCRGAVVVFAGVPVVRSTLQASVTTGWCGPHRCGGAMWSMSQSGAGTFAAARRRGR